jgi:hypothetical protein
LAGFDSPVSNHLHTALLWCARTTRGLRVYERNNEMLQQYLERAHTALAAALELESEITLVVGEDRLLRGKDAVHLSTDRVEGLPFTFFRNAFRRLTFVRGMSSNELLELLHAVTMDYSSFDLVGEDLVSTLWRLALPHFRYLTIDALGMSVAGHGHAARADSADGENVERLRGEVDDLLVKLYTMHNAAVAEDDLARGLSIGKEDLEALREIRKEDPEELERLEVRTAREIARVEAGELAAMTDELAREDHDQLVLRMIEVLLEVMAREQSSQEFTQTIELIQQLFDSLLLANRFEHAAELVRELRTRQMDPDRDLRMVHMYRHLLRLFSMEARLRHVVTVFNDATQTALIHNVLDFLRALGPEVGSGILSILDQLTSATHRRMLLELLGELGLPEAATLQSQLSQAKWFVALDLMNLAQRLPQSQSGQLILDCSNHEHPKVRAHAIALARAYPRGPADEVVLKALDDADPEVRLTACRVAAMRRTPGAAARLEELIAREDVVDRDPKELRTLMMTYALLAGEPGVAALSRILNPSFFAARSKATDAQIAAALALGMIRSERAVEALQQGGRTVNTKVRDACKRALNKRDGSGSGEAPAGPGSSPSWPADPASHSELESLVTAFVDAPPLPDGREQESARRPSLTAAVLEPHREAEVIPERVWNRTSLPPPPLETSRREPTPIELPVEALTPLPTLEESSEPWVATALAMSPPPMFKGPPPAVGRDPLSLPAGRPIVPRSPWSDPPPPPSWGAPPAPSGAATSSTATPSSASESRTIRGAPSEPPPAGRRSSLAPPPSLELPDDAEPLDMSLLGLTSSAPPPPPQAHSSPAPDDPLDIRLDDPAPLDIAMEEPLPPSDPGPLDGATEVIAIPIDRTPADPGQFDIALDELAPPERPEPLDPEPFELAIGELTGPPTGDLEPAAEPDPVEPVELAMNDLSAPPRAAPDPEPLELGLAELRPPSPASTPLAPFEPWRKRVDEELETIEIEDPHSVPPPSPSLTPAAAAATATSAPNAAVPMPSDADVPIDLGDFGPPPARPPSRPAPAPPAAAKVLAFEPVAPAASTTRAEELLPLGFDEPGSWAASIPPPRTPSVRDDLAADLVLDSGPASGRGPRSPTKP